MTYFSTKTYGHEVGLSCCFRQWRAESHCRFLHGYALSIKVMFAAEELDVRNWVVDFGSLKSFKQWLQDTFDHKCLVAKDDPKIAIFRELQVADLIEMVEVDATGCERFAQLIGECTEVWLKDNGYAPRVRVSGVEVKEHGANSALWSPGSAE